MNVEGHGKAFTILVYAAQKKRIFYVDSIISHQINSFYFSKLHQCTPLCHPLIHQFTLERGHHICTVASPCISQNYTQNITKHKK